MSVSCAFEQDTDREKKKEQKASLQSSDQTKSKITGNNEDPNQDMQCFGGSDRESVGQNL
jgi:hypothetical protein